MCDGLDNDCDGLIDEYGACKASCLTVSPGTERCSYPLSDANTTPALGPDGTVYARSTDGRLHAVLEDGTPKWAPYDTGSVGWYAAPVLGADGSVCIGGAPGFLCLDGADGSLIWEATVAGDAGSPTIAPNGAVFFPTTSAFRALCGASPGLADAPWPKDLHDERNAANLGAR